MSSSKLYDMIDHLLAHPTEMGEMSIFMHLSLSTNPLVPWFPMNVNSDDIHLIFNKVSNIFYLSF